MKKVIAYPKHLNAFAKIDKKTIPEPKINLSSYTSINKDYSVNVNFTGKKPIIFGKGDYKKLLKNDAIVSIGLSAGLGLIIAGVMSTVIAALGAPLLTIPIIYTTYPAAAILGATMGMSLGELLISNKISISQYFFNKGKKALLNDPLLSSEIKSRYQQVLTDLTTIAADNQKGIFVSGKIQKQLSQKLIKYKSEKKILKNEISKIAKSINFINLDLKERKTLLEKQDGLIHKLKNIEKNITDIQQDSKKRNLMAYNINQKLDVLQAAIYQLMTNPSKLPHTVIEALKEWLPESYILNRVNQ